MAKLEVITGPMFSGKTEELVRRLGRAKIAGQRILVTKPHRDNRTRRESFGMILENKCLSGYRNLRTRAIESFGDLRDTFTEFQPDVLAIDEAQFFDSWLTEAIQELLSIQHYPRLRIIVSGLDMDFLQRPFGPMPQIMAIADEVQKLTAVCDECGGDAMLTYRKPGNPTDQIVVGDKEIYQARCRSCFAK